MRRALIITATVLIAIAATCLPAGGTQPDTTRRAATPTTTTSRPEPLPHKASSEKSATIDWPAIIRRQHAERAWWQEVVRQQQAARNWRRLLAAIAARQCHGYGCVEGIRVCDAWPGDFPCSIIYRESRFNPRARNSHSTAGGLAQMLNGTFGSICPADRARYGNAANAPVPVQVRCYRALWNHGRGASHWRG